MIKEYIYLSIYLSIREKAEQLIFLKNIDLHAIICVCSKKCSMTSRRDRRPYICLSIKKRQDRRRSEDLCNLFGINCVADVVRRGRLRWFGHLERKSVDDWVSACRRLVVEGATGQGRSRKMWEQCVRDDMKLLGLHSEWAIFRDMWRDLIWGKRLTLA